MGFFSSFHSNEFSTHQSQCGSCAYSTVSTTALKCYCNKRRATYRLDERKCSYYQSDRSKDYDFWRDIYTYYILTAISDILNIDKNNELYQEFMTLIQLVRSDETTMKEAIAYDTFGPMLADNLYQDPNRVEICKNLLTSYLTKAFIAIKENRLEDAINTYVDMVKFLLVKYSSKDNYEIIIDVDTITNPKILIKK